MPRPPLLTACHGAGTWLHIMTFCQGKRSSDPAPVSEGGWERAGGTKASLSGARMTRRAREGHVRADRQHVAAGSLRSCSS